MKNLFTLLLLAMLVTGCATTSWEDATGKSLASVAQSVDSAMKGWATYAAARDIRPNNIVYTRVQAAYEDYQKAMKSAMSAYNAAILSKDQTGWVQAANALSSAQQSLLELITALEAK